MTDWTTDIPGYATALGTLVLATATFYLASKTRESVNENKTLITQGESLVTEAQRQSASAEESAKAAKAQAEFTSNLYLAASQPLAFSSGERNELGEFLHGHHIVERLAWSSVEAALDLSKVSG
jgi:hypothetical protein